MGKIFQDNGSAFKAGIRGMVVGLSAAGIAIQYWLNEDYKSTHDGKIFDGFALLLGVFFILTVVEGILFLLASVQILPKGLLFVIELIGDFVCAVLGIVGGAYNISKCSVKLGEPCYFKSTRPPMYLELSAGILCCLVFLLTALKK